jgi:hypothetical protein
LTKLEEFYVSLTRMLDEFRLDGEMYRFAVCIGNPHYVYREEPPQYYYEQQQEEVAAEQPADFYGDDCGAEKLPQHQEEVLINIQ